MRNGLSSIAQQADRESSGGGDDTQQHPPCIIRENGQRKVREIKLTATVLTTWTAVSHWSLITVGGQASGSKQPRIDIQCT